MAAFNPFIVSCLRLIDEAQLCFVAVGVVGDICRALGADALPFCEDYMTALLAAIGVPVVLLSLPSLDHAYHSSFGSFIPQFFLIYSAFFILSLSLVTCRLGHSLVGRRLASIAASSRRCSAALAISHPPSAAISRFIWTLRCLCCNKLRTPPVRRRSVWHWCC